MRKLTTAFLALALTTSSACGGSELGADVPTTDPIPPPTDPGTADPDAPILQIRSEGGFATPEMIMGRGPSFTLLADGRLIADGPVLLIYPGPLLPNYQMARLSEGQVGEILSLVEEIGLPGMDSEHDDSAGSTVADATTEVITYWDEIGAHEYSVYALGIDPHPSSPATAAAVELVETLSSLGFSGETAAYEPDRVRVIAGVAQTAPDPEFEDLRPWPLEGEDPTKWSQLDLGFTCKVLGGDSLAVFNDATQATQWLDPDATADTPPLVLLVRPLHPGEPDCPPAG